MSKIITLKKMHEPEKIIQGIKEVRAATGLGLRDAKGVVETVRGSGADADHPGHPTPVDIRVRDENDVRNLRAWFDVSDPSEAVTPEDEEVVSRKILADFFVDMCCGIHPSDSGDLQGMESFKAAREALGL